MRKFLSLLTAIVLVAALLCPVLAANGNFVPSISYKPHPSITPVKDPNGNLVFGILYGANGEVLGYLDENCLKITGVADRAECPTLDTLYEELSTGKSELPYEKHEADLNADKMAIREMFYIEWNCEEHKNMLDAEGATLEVVFNLGVAANTDVYTMVYDETAKEWVAIESTNLGDGNVSVVFPTLGAVEFSVAN